MLNDIGKEGKIYQIYDTFNGCFCIYVLKIRVAKSFSRTVLLAQMWNKPLIIFGAGAVAAVIIFTCAMVGTSLRKLSTEEGGSEFACNYYKLFKAI